MIYNSLFGVLLCVINIQQTFAFISLFSLLFSAKIIILFFLFLFHFIFFLEFAWLSWKQRETIKWKLHFFCSFVPFFNWEFYQIENEVFSRLKHIVEVCLHLTWTRHEENELKEPFYICCLLKCDAKIILLKYSYRSFARWPKTVIITWRPLK